MNKISKVILRNRLYNPSELSIRIEMLKEEKSFIDITELITQCSTKSIINHIYNEGITEEPIGESTLYNSYREVLNSGIENADFKLAYRVREDMAIRITDHIYVCRIADDYISDSRRIVPWYCMESEVYIADTWWEEDNDVLNDFTNLSYMDFITKYKMY